ncbi:FAD-dependent urate hydroxylase HpxO [Vibrio viridaestus]|uniref:FAD-dependent urate hydroxylase n=1 Tax=Vibrio viridaestus TaxID=2487322 RepID=A0A3N9TGJ1_9VIBR|nr:FAD-dependent urate hydroxylase HpxO [Vibrio viridaestus]RQW63120.1 FAD-dependent urate hydroxylase HpxO [Vibrio viridaestus]
MKAIVIGAGVGGMSAAAALKKQGIECEIFEAIKDIKPVGAAISVWSNGVKCMNHLGMGSIMDALGGPMHYMAYKEGKTAEVMTQFSLKPLVELVGERPCPVSRADLQASMIDWWGSESIHFGKRLAEIDQDSTGVTVTFTDGSTATADFLIAADGTHSVAREYVLGYKVERRYAGYVNWNGLVEIDESIAPADQWTTFVADGKRVSVMPIADNRFYFFFDVPLPLGLKEDRTTLISDLKRYFEGWSQPVQTLIDAIDPQTTNRIEIHDIEPFEPLVKGRVALLGDAGHSTTPDIGQGGCAALEDSVVLGKCFTDNVTVEQALQHYQEQRVDRVKDLVLKARKRCDVTHGMEPKATEAWYQELRAETGENIMDGLQKTIMGGPL